MEETTIEYQVQTRRLNYTDWTTHVTTLDAVWAGAVAAGFTNPIQNAVRKDCIEYARHMPFTDVRIQLVKTRVSSDTIWSRSL